MKTQLTTLLLTVATFTGSLQTASAMRLPKGSGSSSQQTSLEESFARMNLKQTGSQLNNSTEPQLNDSWNYDEEQPGTPPNQIITPSQNPICPPAPKKETYQSQLSRVLFANFTNGKRIDVIKVNKEALGQNYTSMIITQTPIGSGSLFGIPKSGKIVFDQPRFEEFVTLVISNAAHQGLKGVDGKPTSICLKHEIKITSAKSATTLFLVPEMRQLMTKEGAVVNNPQIIIKVTYSKKKSGQYILEITPLL
jgi:hypothetical protein